MMSEKKLMDIKMELCTLCHEECFDLNVLDGACSKCRSDMDQYDWVGQSPDAETITAACQWLNNEVKESPNDDVQMLPEADYRNLKGEQRKFSCK
jgi:hypothetical protein